MNTASQNERVSILLVDDRPSNLLSLEALLERPDYELVLAASGHEALSHVLRQDFAVILLDVAMPGMDGFETAAIIKEREQSKHIPIIFITASVYEMEHIFRGYTVGAVDYLRKPIDPHAVRAKVAVFAEMYRQRKQIERQAVLIREGELREQRLMRERAEQALAESEAVYKLTFEEAPVGIGSATPEGLWTRVNRRLCSILRRDAPDLLGRSVDDMIGGEEGQAFAARLAQLGETKTVYSGEHHLETAAGVAWVALSVSLLHDPSQGARQLVIVVDDITERKRIELERSRLVRDLREAIKARDDFLSIASHELKTPVTPLRLQASGLMREMEKRPDETLPRDLLMRRIETINRAAERLDALIDRLLDVSRLSVGRLTLELDDVDLEALAKEVAGRMRDAAEASGSTLNVEAEAPAVGRWDRVRLEQVVTNLVANALKYGRGGPIAVRVSADATTARLAVRDHGIGIPPEAQERIFERFERLEPVQNYGGFGLGLWIVREIVHAHGGEITVSSQPGEGSEFTVELPLHPEQAEAMPEQPPARDAAH